jgi:hypothetical protein
MEVELGELKQEANRMQSGEMGDIRTVEGCTR